VIAHQRHAQGSGHRFRGEIVRGGPEAARADQHLVLRRQAGDRGDDALDVVVDRHLRAHLEAERGELLRDPGCVAVDELPASELSADR
jgi:hypothetical protein